MPPGAFVFVSTVAVANGPDAAVTPVSFLVAASSVLLALVGSNVTASSAPR